MLLFTGNERRVIHVKRSMKAFLAFGNERKKS